MSRRSGGGLPARSMMSAIAVGRGNDEHLPVAGGRQIVGSVVRQPIGLAAVGFFGRAGQPCNERFARDRFLCVDDVCHQPFAGAGYLATDDQLVHRSEAGDGRLFDRLDSLLPGGAEGGPNLFGFRMLEQRGRSQHGNDLRAGRKVSEVERLARRSEIPKAAWCLWQPSASWRSSPVSSPEVAISCQRQRSVLAVAVQIGQEDSARTVAPRLVRPEAPMPRRRVQ